MKEGVTSPQTLLRALSDACERYATAYAGKGEKMQVQQEKWKIKRI